MILAMAIVHPTVGPVSRVRHTFVRADRTVSHQISDLIFVKGVPKIVVEWLETPQGDVPLVTISLDGRHLHRLGSLEAERFLETEYLYELEVVDPRRYD